MSSFKKLLRYWFERLTFKRFVILCILFLIALPILKGVFFSSSNTDSAGDQYEYKYTSGDNLSMNKILLVPVQGMIMTESSGAPNPLDVLQTDGVVYGYDIKDILRRAAADDSIKAVLLEINSPGGTVAGSKAISDGIEYYRSKTHNPIYAHISDTGASGAYWSAVTADRVIADTGSMVGSIGVLMGPFKYYDTVTQEGSLLDSVTTQKGIQTYYITAGQYKDTGSPYRQLTQEERDHWQTAVDNEYAVFVDHVHKYRRLSRDTIINQIKALPYETKRALQLHMIDEEGSEERAISELVAKAGIPQDDYQVVSEKRKGGFLDTVLSAAMLSRTPKVQSTCPICDSPLFLYDSTYSSFPK